MQSRRRTNDRLFFDRLSERYRLQGTISTRTGLHVGSGFQHWESASDQAILRDAQGNPFVPGSSVKGVVRSTIESIMRAAKKKDGVVWACDPLSKDGCGAHETGERAEKQEEVAESHCPVCRVFGSHLLASHVRFSDALLAKDCLAQIEVRDGVAIDRDLRIVYGGQKYDFEVVAPGARFDLEVFVDNPEDWGMGLLILGFDQLDQGFSSLGGYSSRGLGRVRIEWQELTTCTAEELLAGSELRSIRGEDLTQKLSDWRNALGRWAQGDV